VSGFWPGYFDTMGWGFGMSVHTHSTQPGHPAGTYGWPGYYGTAWYNDPAENLTAIVLMQRAHAGDQRLPLWQTLWPAIHTSINN
jgi:CubicO group peptidase (beta-lactamase class C family)